MVSSVIVLRRLPLLTAAAALLVVAPAHAGTRQAEPLVDRAPAPGARFADRVVTGQGGAVARAAQAGAQEVRTADGSHAVDVTLSPSFVSNPAIAQSYVDFLHGLAHGAELDRLKMYIGTPEEVTSRCGAAGQAILACYLPAQNLMVVPGEQLQGGVTTAYVVAHEYGHHVANHRSNAPFSAMSFGPKRWASHENVCTKTLAGRLAPGDEGEHYLANPGEAWAETYAQLKYPQAKWNFTPLLAPSTKSFQQALLDVTEPWTQSRSRTFTGTLDGTTSSRRHTFRLTLDGRLSFKLAGPDGANFDLTVRTNGKDQGSTKAGGSRDGLAFTAACVAEPETVAVTVKRRSGSGPYTLTVALAG